MTYATASINPHYAARLRRAFAVRPPEPDRTIYARLPRAPITGSPVPHLTSLYHFHRTGEYGDRKWPGNCGGNLIKDLLTYFKPGLCFDPMAGIGHLPGRMRGTRHPMHRLGHPPGAGCLRREGFPDGGDVRFHLGTPALLADEAIRRRSPRPVTQPDARAFPPPIRPVHPQLCRCPETRRQARHPHGRLQRPRGRIRAAGVSHQAAGLCRRTYPALHRHHPIQPRQQQQQEGLPIIIHPRPARRLHDL